MKTNTRIAQQIYPRAQLLGLHLSVRAERKPLQEGQHDGNQTSNSDNHVLLLLISLFIPFIHTYNEAASDAEELSLMENGESTNRSRHTTLVNELLSDSFIIIFKNIIIHVCNTYSVSKLLILVISILVHSTSSLKITRLVGSGYHVLLETLCPIPIVSFLLHIQVIPQSFCTLFCF